MVQEKNRRYKSFSKIKKMISNGLRSSLFIGLLCISCFVFSLAGRFFFTPDEHLETVVRKVMNPVKSFVEDVFSGSEKQEEIRSQMDLISKKGFAFHLSDDGVISPYAPYHITLTYDEANIPRDIKPRLKELVGQALEKVWLMPNALDVAMGRFMVLTFLKEYVPDQSNPLTADEERALKVINEFSGEKLDELPHISLVEWISGKEKRRGLKEAVMSNQEDTDDIISGTEVYLVGWFNAMEKLKKEDPMAKKTLKGAYLALSEARSYLNFPPFTFSDGQILDLENVDLNGWMATFIGDPADKDIRRIGEFSRYIEKKEWRKKLLMRSMKPLVSQVTKMARQIEGDIRAQLQQDSKRPPVGSEARAAASGPIGKLYEESEYKLFQAQLASDAGFKEWYGARRQEPQDSDLASPSDVGASAEGGASAKMATLQKKDQGRQTIEAARQYYLRTMSETAGITGKGGENWTGLPKKDRKAARAALIKLGKALDKEVPVGEEVDALVQELKAYTDMMS